MLLLNNQKAARRTSAPSSWSQGNKQPSVPCTFAIGGGLSITLRRVEEVVRAHVDLIQTYLDEIARQGI